MGVRTPNWISSLPKNIGWPPRAVTAPSVDTLVRVLRLLKVMATVLPDRVPSNLLEPDLMDCLCKCALRTRVTNSWGVKSAIDNRCRGAAGEAGEE